jgi:hypothetical protein
MRKDPVAALNAANMKKSAPISAENRHRYHYYATVHDGSHGVVDGVFATATKILDRPALDNLRAGIALDMGCRSPGVIAINSLTYLGESL